MERLKEFFLNYGIYILTMAIFAVLVLLFLPEDAIVTKPVINSNENISEPVEEPIEEPVPKTETNTKSNTKANTKSNTKTKTEMKTETTAETKTSTLKLTLEGEKAISIVKGKAYKEAGYTATDTKDGNLTKQVVVEGSVNTQTVGTYTIKYTVTNSSGQTVSETRTVYVVADTSTVNVTADYSPKTLTNKDVTITVQISGDGYNFTLTPDSKETNKATISYIATKNDKYEFFIKKKDGTVVTKTVEIKNIDKKKPTGSCKNVVSDDKTVITVTAKDENGIKNYNYNFNNKKYDSTSATYTANEQARNVAVTIYDKAGNYEIISCIKVEETWPVSITQDYKTYSAKNYDATLRYDGEGRMNYIIYYPDGMDLTKKNPLVIYLHEVSGFGNDISRTYDTAVQNKKIFTGQMRMGRFRKNAVYIAPQCRNENNAGWVSCLNDLKGLIDYIVKKYNIDTKRISMTGFSVGGAAVFEFIAKYPGMLSAAVALGPTWINTEAYAKMKDLKIVVFTGTVDGNHGRNQTDTTYLKNKGVNIKFFSVQGVDHLTIQHEAYMRRNTVDWMIAQSR